VLRLRLGSYRQSPDMDEAGRGALVKGVTFIISSQAVIIKGIRRFSAYHLAIALVKLNLYLSGNISLGTIHIGSQVLAKSGEP